MDICRARPRERSYTRRWTSIMSPVYAGEGGRLTGTGVTKRKKQSEQGPGISVRRVTNVIYGKVRRVSDSIDFKAAGADATCPLRLPLRTSLSGAERSE